MSRILFRETGVQMGDNMSTVGNNKVISVSPDRLTKSIYSGNICSSKIKGKNHPSA